MSHLVIFFIRLLLVVPLLYIALRNARVFHLHLHFKKLTRKSFLLACALLVGSAAFCTTDSAYAASKNFPAKQWGTYLTPFSADSLWNARPVGPVFGDFVIPKSTYSPSVANGVWSTGVFLSKEGDGPMVVKPIRGKPGVWDPDAEAVRAEIVIPRWPDDVLPAAGGDGHAEIVDPISGIIHSFWQLRKQDDQWVAAQYAWTRIDGRGWGDPAHYFQGARAAGVPTSAGLVRKHEVNDGERIYKHALAMSLTFTGLSAGPTYIYPATSADTGAMKKNSGGIPEGALMMLPPTFDTAQITNPALRKVAMTLQVYGAYVVDQNFGTPFAIYVENDADFKLHAGGWNNAVAADLDRIRAALRQVVSAKGWLDGNDQPMTPQRNFNLLSMRGPWQLKEGTTSGTYDTWKQELLFPPSETRVVQINSTSNSLNKIAWALPRVGTDYLLTVSATGGAKLRLQVRDIVGATVFDSGDLGQAESIRFEWPVSDAKIVLYAISGVGKASTVKGDLRVAEPGKNNATSDKCQRETGQSQHNSRDK